MKKGFIICLGVLMLCLCFPFQTKAILMPPIDSIYYYIKVDTMDVPVGYLRVDSTDTHQTLVDDVKGDFALWRFKKHAGSVVDYYIINKKTGDTLAFDVPATNVPAVINPEGEMNIWFDLFDFDEEADLFQTAASAQNYYLTYYNGDIFVSPSSSSLKRMAFRIERPKYTPVVGNYYRIRVDLQGDSYYLRADTLTARRDSLAIDTAHNDLALWQFDVDTLINDTTVYKIKNKATDVLLAFNVPSQDTIAFVKDNGKLNQWLTPFYTEDDRTAPLMVRDTSTQLKYYIGIDPDTVVMLLNVSTTLQRLSFYLEDETQPKPIQYQFDSTQVYRIKYISGTLKNKYMGNDFDESIISIEDSVYAHIPDGQYVVNPLNTYSLINRTLKDLVYTDTIYYAFDGSGNRIPNWFVYGDGGDTIEVTPITYGSFDKTNPTLGYKYVHPSSLSAYAHYFMYSNTADSLKGRILGADTAVMLIAMQTGMDTAKYLLEEAGMLPGVPATGDIAMLRKYQYYLRSAIDTTLYLSGGSPSVLTNNKNNAGRYYLKESIHAGEYYLIRNVPTPSHKLIIDSVSLQLIHAPKDTLAFSLFRIEQTARPSYEEPDPYTYLTQLPDIKGKGYYELRITDPRSSHLKYLTKNFYDYAVLGLEGESSLRAGSFTPFDLQLWADTARGPHIQPDKPSFYIVKDVDTTSANFDPLKIEGYFLHVLDSTANPSNRANMVEVDGKAYNRLNYVQATRSTANELQLSATRTISGPAINEYRFYFQHTDEAGRYYLVTEAGYGDGGRTNARGYLSIKNDTIYVGPRDGALKVQFRGSEVSNVIIPAILAMPEEASREITIIGQSGQIDILHAAGQPVLVYNMLGRLIVQRTLATDHETIPATRGIHIVKAGPVTRKVIVQ